MGFGESILEIGTRCVINVRMTFKPTEVDVVIERQGCRGGTLGQATRNVAIISRNHMDVF